MAVELTNGQVESLARGLFNSGSFWDYYKEHPGEYERILKEAEEEENEKNEKEVA